MKNHILLIWLLAMGLALMGANAFAQVCPEPPPPFPVDLAPLLQKIGSEDRAVAGKAEDDINAALQKHKPGVLQMRAFLELATEGNHQQRVFVLRSMGNFRHLAEVELKEQLIPLLLKVTREEKDLRLRRAAIMGMQWYVAVDKEVVKTLIECMRVDDWRNGEEGVPRLAAGGLLGPHPDCERSHRLLIRACESSDVNRRALGIVMVGQLGNQRKYVAVALPILCTVAASEKESYYMRASALHGLLIMSEHAKEAVPTLHELIQKTTKHKSRTNAVLRKRAMSVLWRVGAAAEPTVGTMMKLIHDCSEDRETHVRALDVLGNIGAAAKPQLRDLEALVVPLEKMRRDDLHFQTRLTSVISKIRASKE